MINAEKLLGKMVKQSLSKGLRGKKGLTSAIPGGWKSIAGVGALGVVIAAFDHFTQNRQAAPPAKPQSYPPPGPGTGKSAKGPPPPPPPPVTALSGPSTSPSGGSSLQDESLLLIRSMLAAANADGKIDQQERDIILRHLRESGASPEEERFFVQELESPPSIDSLLPSITTPELALEVYTVSLLAIEVDSQAERDYLVYLRSRLSLNEAETLDIHEKLNLSI